MAEKLIYTVEINTDDSAKSIKTLKEDIKSLNKALAEVEIGTEQFDEINGKIIELQNELRGAGVAVNSITDLKNQIKLLNAELESAPIGSQKYKELTESLALAKGQLKEFRNEAKALSSTNESLNVFIKLGRNIAGAFNVAQSSLALFGEENEEVAEAIQKSVGAIQLLQGVQALSNSLENTRLAGVVLGWKKTTAEIQKATVAQQASNTATIAGSNAFKILKVAIASTGIGLLVVSLGALIANFDKIKAKAQELIPGLKNLGESFLKVKAVIAGVFDAIFVYYSTLAEATQQLWSFQFGAVINTLKELPQRISDAVEKAEVRVFENDKKKRLARITQREIEETERIIALTKARGEETYELEKLNLERQLSLLEAGSKEYLDKQNEIAVLEATREKEIADERIKNAKKTADESAKAEIEAKKRAQEAIKALDEETASNLDAFQAEYDAREATLQRYYDEQRLLILQTAEAEIEANNQSGLSKEEIAEKNKKVIEDSNKAIIESEKKRVEEQIKINQQRIGEVNKIYDDEVKAIEQAVEDKVLTEEQGAERIKELEDSRLEDINKINDEIVDAETLLQEDRLEEIEKGLDAEAQLRNEKGEKRKQEEEELERKIIDARRRLQEEAINAYFEFLSDTIQRTTDELIENLDEATEAQLDILQKRKEQGLITEEEYESGVINIRKKYDAQRKKILIQQFKKQKAAAITEAFIRTAISVVGALSQPPFPPKTIPLGILAGALGAIQIAKIASQPVPQFAKGGVNKTSKTSNYYTYQNSTYNTSNIHDVRNGQLLTGSQYAGTEKSDDNLALLSKGEAVINARSVAIPGVLPLLSRINELGGGVKFAYAQGGLNQFSSSQIVQTATSGGGATAPLVDNSRVEGLLEQLVNQKFKAYVVSTEMTSQQSEDSTIEGRANF